MKRKHFFVFGMLAIVLACGFVYVGCETGNNGDGGNSRFNGTWINGILSIEITGDSYTLKGYGTNISKGTFSTTGTNSGSVTFNVTHIWNSSWQSNPMTDIGTWSLANGNTLIIDELTTLSTANGTWTK
jgi:hypothetical protein